MSWSPISGEGSLDFDSGVPFWEAVGLGRQCGTVVNHGFFGVLSKRMSLMNFSPRSLNEWDTGA